MDEVLAGQRDAFRLIVRDYGLGVRLKIMRAEESCFFRQSLKPTT